MTTQPKEETFEERRERERKEEKERVEAALKIFRAVARLLGMQFKEHGEREYSATAYMFKDKDGAKIFLQSGDYHNKEKVRVSASYPRLVGGGESVYKNMPDSIQISIKKTPQQIAHDIERRFLPLWQLGAQESAERMEAAIYDRAQRLDIMQRLADKLGVKLDQGPEHSREEGRPRINVFNYSEDAKKIKPVQTMEAETSHDGQRVSFKIECDGITALMIAEALKGRV